MNWLQAAAGERPALETRERLPGKVEARCPCCGTWRPGFTIVQLSAADAALHGTDWACDADLTRWARP